MFSSQEIQKQVQNTYIERVSQRLKKMRKQLNDRDWIGLKHEATHLAEGAENYGFQNLAEEVHRALDVLQNRHLTRTSMDSEAKTTLEALFQKLDRFLVEQQAK